MKTFKIKAVSIAVLSILKIQIWALPKAS